MKILTIKDLIINNLTKDKRIIIRVDFNVPIDNGVIMNDQRIVQSLPTIKYLIEHGDFKSIVILKKLFFRHLKTNTNPQKTFLPPT